MLLCILSDTQHFQEGYEQCRIKQYKFERYSAVHSSLWAKISPQFQNLLKQHSTGIVCTKIINNPEMKSTMCCLKVPHSYLKTYPNKAGRAHNVQHIPPLFPTLPTCEGVMGSLPPHPASQQGNKAWPCSKCRQISGLEDVFLCVFLFCFTFPPLCAWIREAGQQWAASLPTWHSALEFLPPWEAQCSLCHTKHIPQTRKCL